MCDCGSAGVYGNLGFGNNVYILVNIISGQDLYILHLFKFYNEVEPTRPDG